MESENSIGKFCASKSVSIVKLSSLSHSLSQEKFKFNYTFWITKFAFYTLQKPFQAPCASRAKSVTILPMENHSPQKQKRSKPSTHLNSLNNSNLTKQSQNDLYLSQPISESKMLITHSTIVAPIYICSKPTPPVTWKINKACQGWITHNIRTSKVGLVWRCAWDTWFTSHTF